MQEWFSLGEFDIEALIRAAELGDDYRFGGPAFQGLLRFDFASPLQTSFAKPPVITLVGGNINQRLTVRTKISTAKLRQSWMKMVGSYQHYPDPGAYYYSEPPFSGWSNLPINHYMTSVFPRRLQPHGSGGLGYVGGPGSHVTYAASDPTTENAMKFVVGSGLTKNWVTTSISTNEYLPP